MEKYKNMPSNNRPREYTQWMILDLWKMDSHLRFTTNQIARALNLSSRAINKHLVELVKNGYLKRTPDFMDMRTFYYELIK